MGCHGRTMTAAKLTVIANPDIYQGKLREAIFFLKSLPCLTGRQAGSD
jgi:hypothetical protein